MIPEKIYVVIIATLFILIATMPGVIAATEDDVTITFDPDGVIDIDISPDSYAYGSVQANQWSNTTGSYFTLYNNGTVAMDTEIRTNATTDETDMTLNAAGTPGQDEYSINITGLLTEGFIDTTYSTEFDQNLNPNDSKGFDMCLLLGTNLTANHTTQTTTVYFRGSQS